MHERGADWTLFWRQLAELRARVSGSVEVDREVVAQIMTPAFYHVSARTADDVTVWLRSQWIPAVAGGGVDAAAASAAMKQVSPKYAPLASPTAFL